MQSTAIGGGRAKGPVRWVDAEEDIGWARRQIAAKKNAP
jgi:hypothetical protein